MDVEERRISVGCLVVGRGGLGVESLGGVFEQGVVRVLVLFL